jgi:hypothetical protein
MTIAQVIDTTIAYKTTPNKTRPDRGDFPLGVIKCRSVGKNLVSTGEFYAYPASSYCNIPLFGEHVICFLAYSDYGLGGAPEQVWYYTHPVALRGNFNLNPLVDLYSVATGTTLVKGAPTNKDIQGYKPGKTFKENEQVKNVQPFEGDVLIQGRFGQSIRLGSTVTGDMSQYAEKPYWQGANGSPITIISNGHKGSGGPNKYIIEDPKDTKSIFYLTTDQKIQLETSQKMLGLGVLPLSAYSKSQAIISADRLLFNSKEDEIILSGKKTVSIATPKWQMDMDKLFTILEKTLQQLSDLTAGKAFWPTPVGGQTLVATNVSQVAQLLAEIKTMKQ